MNFYSSQLNWVLFHSLKLAVQGRPGDSFRPGFGKLWKLIMQRLFNMAMESFGFLFGEILKYPKADIT